MKPTNAIAAAVLAALGALATPAMGQYSLAWCTIDGGGQMFGSAGGYTLGATAGQPDAGRMSGGSYTLVGGFWADQPPCSLAADIDADGDVDLTDLAILLANYGLPSGVDFADGDLDGDSDVDLADLSTLLSMFGLTCP